MLPSIGLEASPDFGYKVHLAKDDYRDDASKLPCPRSEGKKKKKKINGCGFRDERNTNNGMRRREKKAKGGNEGNEKDYRLQF